MLLLLSIEKRQGLLISTVPNSELKFMVAGKENITLTDAQWLCSFGPFLDDVRCHIIIGTSPTVERLTHPYPSGDSRRFS